MRRVKALKVPDFFRSQSSPPPVRYGSRFGTLTGGVLFVVVGLLLFSALIHLWPVVDRTGAAANTPKKVSLGLGELAIDAKVSKATGLLLLAMIMGAIGGYIHAATSFATYLGNRNFKASWGWWYGLRAFVGSGLALLLYFAVRAGLLGAGTGTRSIDPYGVALVSGLAGLFSKQATDKLEEVFNTAFKTSEGAGDDQRTDKADERLPVITGIAPNPIGHAQAADLTVSGLRFGAGAKIELDGQPLDTGTDASGNLTAQVPADRFAKPGAHKVTVLTAAGSRSAARTLKVT